MDLKNKKYKENYTQAQHSTLLKTCDKEKIMKAVKERGQAMYKGTRTRMTADSSLEIIQVRRQQMNILKVLKEKNLSN